MWFHGQAGMSGTLHTDAPTDVDTRTVTCAPQRRLPAGVSSRRPTGSPATNLTHRPAGRIGCGMGHAQSVKASRIEYMLLSGPMASPHSYSPGLPVYTQELDQGTVKAEAHMDALHIVCSSLNIVASVRLSSRYHTIRRPCTGMQCCSRTARRNTLYSLRASKADRKHYVHTTAHGAVRADRLELGCRVPPTIADMAVVPIPRATSVAIGVHKAVAILNST
jgi:hypothetical protein